MLLFLFRFLFLTSTSELAIKMQLILCKDNMIIEKHRVKNGQKLIGMTLHHRGTIPILPHAVARQDARTPKNKIKT